MLNGVTSPLRGEGQEKQEVILEPFLRWDS
jgi:hypothetical protein